MFMINIGSENPVKIEAVREILENYAFLHPFQVNSMCAEPEVSEQPKSLEEIVRGAKNRARNAFICCNYSIGLESGLMRVPGSRTGFMNFVACSIHDGNNYSLGLSQAFEFPKEIIGLVGKGMNIGQAVYEIGLTENSKIGSSEGIISVLTKGRITRKDYTKQAIQMALIQLENYDLYK